MYWRKKTSSASISVCSSHASTEVNFNDNGVETQWCAARVWHQAKKGRQETYDIYFAEVCFDPRILYYDVLKVGRTNI